MLRRLKWGTFLLMDALISIVPLWTQLNSIGKSRAVSMTALVPFIGSFILFNNNLYKYLDLIPQISSAPHILQLSFLTKLYLLYFGLSALGIGSILFNISCPDEVKKFGSLHPFVAAEQSLSTLPRITIMVVNIANHYLRYKGHGNEDLDSFWDRVGFNEKLELLCYQTFSVIADKTADEIEDIQREGDDDEGGFFSYRGYINIRRWMLVLAGPPTALRAVAYTFYQKSVESSVDIAAVYFSTKDQTKPLMRISISILFAIGFFGLSIPTLSAFVSIVSSLVHN